MLYPSIKVITAGYDHQEHKKGIKLFCRSAEEKDPMGFKIFWSQQLAISICLEISFFR